MARDLLISVVFCGGLFLAGLLAVGIVSGRFVPFVAIGIGVIAR
jgi:hypothetical protein